ARASARARHSRGRRGRGHAAVPTWADVLSPLLGAYGVSCRARVNFDATPHLWRLAPAAKGRIGSPAPSARGVRDSARTRGKLALFPAICVARGGLHRFLPTCS